MSENKSILARLRAAVARLAPSQDGDADPQARDERPITVAREEYTQEPDREDIDRWIREYYRNPLIRQSVRNFASDVVEPGAAVEVTTPGDEEEPEVPQDYRFQEFRGSDLSDALETWLGQCAIVGGRFDRDISDLLEDVVIDLRGRRGTALVEHAYDDPAEREYILGLRGFKSETTTAYTRDGKNILLRPQDTDVDFETVAVQNIAGDPSRFDSAPTTPADHAAAFVQYDDIFGDYDEKDDIPFALDDVTLISNDPDTGTIFGQPDSASVVDRSEELREEFSDTAQAIKAVGYGHWLATVDTDDEKEARKLLDSLDPSTPENIDVVNYAVELDQFDSDVPANVDHIQQQIEYILSSLPTPLYRVGFAGDINRDVTGIQQEDYRDEIARERDRLESAFHDVINQKAREFLVDDAKSDERLDVDVSLSIRPEDAESPLVDEEFDADEFSSVMQGLKSAAPGGAVEQLVPPHELRETFLGLDPEPPEAPNADEDATMALPDEADERVRETFREAYLGAEEPFEGVPVIPTGIEALSDAWVRRWAEWIAAGRPEIAQSDRLAEVAELDWNPALHPRDPDTGQFVERSFDLPDDTPDFGDMSVGETLSYIDENGGDVAGTVFDPDSPVTVDGVPNDATSLDDVGDGEGGSPSASASTLADRAAEIRDSDAAEFEKRDEIESLVEDEADVRVRFDDFTPEQAVEVAAGVSAVIEREGALPDHLDTIRSGISAEVKEDSAATPLGIHRMVNDVGVIELDPDQFDGETLERLNEDGFLVGDRPRDAMIHELGHAVHRDRAINGDGDGYVGKSMPMGAETKDTIRDNLSDYAAENVKEFVAEGYTARVTGDGIDDDELAGLLDFFLGTDQA